MTIDHPRGAAVTMLVIVRRSMSSRTVRLRRWQKLALDRFDSRDRDDFLTVATPGAGKTTFALAVARRAIAASRARLVVVAPTQHLKSQWADAAEAFGIHLETSWTAGQGGLPADVHGMVTTYQQVAASPGEMSRLSAGAFVVLDEVHHAGDDRAWGDAVKAAFARSVTRLALSGTPFRSDTLAIPFVKYDTGGLAVPDFDYGYGPALADGGVVRPVHFPRLDGAMEWTDGDGHVAAATFQDRLDRRGSAARLRTALSPDGEWLPHILSRAHERLAEIRAGQHRDAGGLVIAMDQGHARAIADLMRRRLGVRPVVVVSEDADASARIRSFGLGSEPWIVAVRMVSEGVDIPRLRVGVFATTTTTELFFRQAVGRIARRIRGLGSQPAYMFIPDDPRLRAHAHAIAEQRRHSLRRDEDADREQPVIVDPAELDRMDERDADQLSLFMPLSATPTGQAGLHDPTHLGLTVNDEEEDEGLMLELEDVPHLATPDADAVSPRERRQGLRDANADVVRQLSRDRRLPHAQVNAELNRLIGIRAIGEATIKQLEARHRAAERWLVGLPPVA